VPKLTSNPGKHGSLAFPSAGNVYAFRTSPFSEFGPLETGRYAAFKILGADEKLVVIGVLNGIWNAPPGLEIVRGAAILRAERFGCSSHPEVFGLNADWWTPSDLQAVVLLGDDRISAEDKRLAAQVASYAPGSRYSTLETADRVAEAEWRWAHDRDALIAEYQQKTAQDELARAAREERYRNRLKNLTWATLLAETPLERWSPSPPFPSAEFTSEARETIRAACIALNALGPKPRKAEVRAVLKTCVEWFNAADERAGGVIETEEREDICAMLEEMAFVARQKDLVDELDQWRNW
jgi:hypothetical protein